MKSISFFSSICSLTFVAASMGICGCAGFDTSSLPSTSGTVTSQGQVGPISGSDYGGHAPLAGAHIYLVQPTTNGYGAVVKGLLTAGGTGSATTKNGSWTNSGFASDQFVPSADSNGNPFYGVLADNNGAFNLTGDYTCTVGLPVIVIGYGGSPTYPSGSNTFQVSQLVISNLSGSGSTATATYTYTTTTTENFYIGEAMQFTAMSADAPGALPYSAAVISTNLTTTTFAVTVTGNSQANGTYAVTGTVTASPTFNPAAANMATLGVCPASGNFSTGATAVSYVYMNEVSTTATAFAFAGFTNTTANDQSGNDEFHLGVGGAGSIGLHAMANAALTAKNLYDITGSQISTTYAGEGHIANTVTPNGGNGSVPQATMDTIGNILAACVDSNNTYRLFTGTISPQCGTLFAYAEDNGVYDVSSDNVKTTGHQAFNIAQAAFNIARFPQGAGRGTTTGTTQTVTPGDASSASSFVSALYTLPTGNVPFTPHLTSQPNDLGIAITWSDANANGGTAAPITHLAVDAVGSIWTVSPLGKSTGAVFQFLPNGAVSTYTANLSGTSNAGITVNTASDTGSYPNDSYIPNVYVPGSTGVYQFTQGTSVGVQVDAAGNAVAAGAIAIDPTVTPNQLYVASHDNTGTSSLVKESVMGVASGTPYPLTTSANSFAANTSQACMYYLAYLTVDQSANIWTSDADTDNFVPGNHVCRYNAAGALQYSFQLPGSNPLPHELAIDHGNNAWFADKNTGLLYKIASGSTANNSGGTTQTGGGLNAPKGIAIDGSNTTWVSNTAGAGGVVNYSNANTNLTPNYITAGVPQTDLTYIAVDISGNVWAAATGEGFLIQYVGAATPVIAPLASGTLYGALGTRPN